MLVEHSDSNKQMIPQALIYSSKYFIPYQNIIYIIYYNIYNKYLCISLLINYYCILFYTYIYIFFQKKFLLLLLTSNDMDDGAGRQN